MDKQNLNQMLTAEKQLWGNGVGDTGEIPKIIWTFWDSPKPSALVEICFEQIRNLLPDFKFHVITKTNVSEFLDELPPLRTDISFINYTDLVRLKLIEKYGGIWLDASVLLTENFDWLQEIKKINQSDFIGFIADFFTTDFNFPLIETWFLASAPQNLFIKAWSEEFEKCYTSPNPHRYFDEEKKTIPNFTHKIDEPLSEYLIAYLAASKVIKRNQYYKLALFPSSETAHYYNFGTQLKPHQFKRYFLDENGKPKIWKMLKFERKGRNALDENIYNGFY